jgi:type IX secretion system substrate protein
MKKLLLSLLLLFYSSLSFSQFVEDFENTMEIIETTSGNLGTRFDVSQFAKGMYLIELTSDSNSKVTKKLIIK